MPHPASCIRSLTRERERIPQPQLFFPSCLGWPVAVWPAQAA